MLHITQRDNSTHISHIRLFRPMCEIFLANWGLYVDKNESDSSIDNLIIKSV
jgi:hypothetical protein